MKKILALILALCLSLSLAACGGNNDPQDQNSPAGDDPATTTAPAQSAAVEEGGDTESDVAYVQEQGTLYVGITNFAPMDYKEAGQRRVDRL